MKFSATMKFALLPIATLCMSAYAQEDKVELRMADSLPNGHIISENSTKPWMEMVKKMSNGKIDIKYFPAQQLGKAKDLLALTQAGAVDIGYVAPSYVSDKMPLSAVAELPGAFSSACEVMGAYWGLIKEGGYLYENEFKPNKIRALFLAALPPYQMVISNSKSVSTLKDFEGFKLRASGGAQDLTLRKMNVVPVKMAPPDLYEAMSRGTIDGTLLSFVSVESYKLQPLTKSATVGANFGTVVVTYSISDAKWNKLPKDVQNILKQAGDEITKQSCSTYDSQETAAANNLKANGTKLVTFQGADKAFLEKAADEVATDWAEGLDKRGKPGTATLQAFRAALKQVK